MGFDRTRVVFSGKDTRRGVAVTWNNNTNDDFLLQSRVVPVDSIAVAPDTLKALPEATGGDIPFIVVPPLVRIDGHGRQVLRLMRKEGALPENRESVFLLVSKAIPNTPVTGKESGGVLRLAMASAIKLFWRPEGLPEGGVASVADRLIFSRAGNEVVVRNPSPFWLTFAVLEIGGKPVNNDDLDWMVPPDGSVRYRMPSGTDTRVRWRLLDERGEMTPWAQGLLR